MAILGYTDRSLFIRDFGLDEWLKTRGVSGWLEMATAHLEAPAKQRIAREIEAHYAEAVKDHMAAGEPELSAQMTALKELGDPQVAAVNFQKSHLTEFEAKLMRRMERTASKPFFSGWAVLLDTMPLAGAAFLFSYAHHYTLGHDCLYLGGLALVFYTGWRLIPRLLLVTTPQSPALFRGMALCQLTTLAVVLPGFYLIPITRDRGVWSLIDVWSVFSDVLWFFIFSYQMNPGLRILRKLRKMDVNRNELPPWQTPVS